MEAVNVGFNIDAFILLSHQVYDGMTNMDDLEDYGRNSFDQFN